MNEIDSMASIEYAYLKSYLLVLQEINREEVTKYEEDALLLSCSAVCFVGLC